MFHDRTLAKVARRLEEGPDPAEAVPPTPVAELLARIEAALAAGPTPGGVQRGR